MIKIKLNKGRNLKIAGAVENLKPSSNIIPELCAVCPDDFPGFVPKSAVIAGDIVSIGTALLYDKKRPTLKIVSPVAGTVREVVRGERRKILRIEIEVAKEQEYKQFGKANDTDELRTLLAESGLMAMMRQRPYDIVPNPNDSVRDIFVTAINSAPLSIAVQTPQADDLKAVETAVAALSKLTNGKVYISYLAGTDFPNITNAEMVEIAGPHPVGNVGVQIANTKPINKGEIVWTMNLQVLIQIGKLLINGTIDSKVDVAIVGPEVQTPTIIRTIIGASINPIVKGKLADDGRNKRIICGNILSGISVGGGTDAFLRYPYNQISVIAEGDDVDEFMGWAGISPKKLSESRSFPLRFLSRVFRPDARLNGSRRAMIMSGEYDRMIPMDILPEYLIKAIIAKDVEQMEQLGIYEVAPEDFALAEYADTSKLPLQQIVRDGLDYLRKELE